MTSYLHSFLSIAWILLSRVCDGLSMPSRVLGTYLTLADDAHANFTSQINWQPELYTYQRDGFNVFWFAFINPQNMTVPKSFANLANCRGQAGCPSQEQLIIFSIGGQLYSEQTWPWLQSPALAESMAYTVAGWVLTYNIDGIDIDIEGSAGDDNNACSNVIVFINTLRTTLNSDNKASVITAPVYGYPQIPAEIDIVNNAFSQSGLCPGNVDSIGIMVYDDEESLEWVPDYQNATSQYQGFPITANVPSKNILVGLQGTAESSVILDMANDVINENLLGIMVWYASVYDKSRNKGGLTYNGGIDDASATRNASAFTWHQALEILESNESDKKTHKKKKNMIVRKVREGEI